MAHGMEALFKRRYGPYSNPLPEVNSVAEHVPFVPREARGGDTYEFPILLGVEQGATRSVSGEAFTLRAARNATTATCRLKGASINMVVSIPRDVIAQSMNGASNGAMGGAYFQDLDFKVLAMLRGAELHRELDLMYGVGSASAAATNIGVVSTVVSGTNLGSSGPMVVDLTRDSWAGGLWNALGTNGQVDIYEANGSTLVAADVDVAYVAGSNCRLSLSKSGSSAAVEATDVIVPAGSRQNSCYGLQPILNNTGELFNINATNPLWRAVQFATTGNLTRAKIMTFAAILEENGLSEGGRLFVNARTFGALGEEANLLVQYPGQTAVKRQGTSKLVYDTPAGVFEVVVHKYMKQSIAMFIGNNCAERPGTCDVSLQLPGSQKYFYQESATVAGSIIQCYANQAIVLRKPNHCGIITGLQNTGDSTPSA